MKISRIYTFSNYYYVDKTKENAMGGKCSMVGELIHTYIILVGKPEGKI
jgi:hypothetical protein